MTAVPAAGPDGNGVRWFGNTHPALRACWHPIAEVAALDGDGPHPVRLLGESWALVRLGDDWSLLPDRCPHRLAPLTAGVIVAGADGPVVECAYHGWCFDGAGRCVEVPASGPGAAVPPTAHLRPAAAVAERYGLVWASVDGPVTPIPEVPEWGDDRYGVVRLDPQAWSAGAAQMADNFLDVAHFPFTHTATIGDPDDRAVRPYELARDGWVFTAEHRHSSQVIGGEPGDMFERVMRFTCTAPHHVRLMLDYGPAGIMVLVFFHQPIDEHTTVLYCMELAENVADGRVSAEDAAAFQVAVATEDRQLLERFETKAVPLDPGVETHVRADRITVELRRVLAELASLAD
ncbi:MAG: aromatic ring-hydroxylating dioxygenase subunit alpha [Actinomycetota bacterium]|nr:aromatic ring-hydroxylating dioxygenase subunit alpha [Actinomycetota bacterium]